MKLSYQYRIKPNTEQKLMLNRIRRLYQYTYNRVLGERLDWWETHRCYIDACPLICYLPEYYKLMGRSTRELRETR